jgi:hypothetical protein
MSFFGDNCTIPADEKYPEITGENRVSSLIVFQYISAYNKPTLMVVLFLRTNWVAVAIRSRHVIWWPCITTESLLSKRSFPGVNDSIG